MLVPQDVQACGMCSVCIQERLAAVTVAKKKPKSTQPQVCTAGHDPFWAGR